MYRRLNNLKYKNSKLKTMLGIGGWKYIKTRFHFFEDN
jgi:GH18 family chitinase